MRKPSSIVRFEAMLTDALISNIGTPSKIPTRPRKKKTGKAHKRTK